MATKRFLIAGMLGLALLSASGYALAGSQSSLAEAREATARFHDLDAAKAAGYTIELPDVFGKTCITNLTDPSAGAMGVHMVNPGLLDATIDATAPEALVYERRNNGTFKFIALEYVIFQSAAGTAPQLFGVPFNAADGSRYGIPPYYYLHAWIWKPNPTETTGIFSDWNPRVSCDS